MKVPALCLAVVLAAFAAVVFATTGMLPERLATHFNGAGVPNGWMTKQGYLTFILAFGLGMGVLLPVIFYIAKFFPPSMVNIPRRDYLLAPERSAFTYYILARSGFWFAILDTLLILGLHVMTIQANHVSPVRLSNSVWLLIGGYLLGLVAWIYFALLRPLRQIT